MDYFASNQNETPQRGDLLISEPFLPDPNFDRTVVYLCEHDENGTFGFVLNKKAQLKLGDVVDEASGSFSELYFGGPVQRDTLHFIHRERKLSEGSKLIENEVFWGGNYELLLELLNLGSISENDIRFFLGYSGWSSGQLADELKENSWIILKQPTQEMIFDWDNQELWKVRLNSMGGKYRLMSNYPKDPRMN